MSARVFYIETSIGAPNLAHDNPAEVLLFVDVDATTLLFGLTLPATIRELVYSQVDDSARVTNALDTLDEASRERLLALRLYPGDFVRVYTSAPDEDTTQSDTL